MSEGGAMKAVYLLCVALAGLWAGILCGSGCAYLAAGDRAVIDAWRDTWPIPEKEVDTAGEW